MRHKSRQNSFFPVREKAESLSGVMSITAGKLYDSLNARHRSAQAYALVMQITPR
jgi:hypothetical protein